MTGNTELRTRNAAANYLTMSRCVVAWKQNVVMHNIDY